MARRIARRRVNAGALLSVIILALIIIVSLVFIITNRPPSTGKPADTSAPAAADSAAADVTSPPETEPTYDTVVKPADDVRRGWLIVVSAAHPYMFPEAGEQKIVTVYGNKSSNFKVSDTLVSLDQDVLAALDTMLTAFAAETGHADVLLRSGHRTLDEQTELYASRVESQGEETAALYVAKPGCSEHHTGWALDLSVYTDEGESFTFDADETYESWFEQHAAEYGFILRYPLSKVSITGIGYEPWHFRYVGVPNAYAISNEGMCLEEYVAFLKENTSFEGEHYKIEHGGETWEVYYVAANGFDGIPDGETAIPVPKGASYEISGDNDNGFIVWYKV